jgi:hypothetical protein
MTQDSPTTSTEWWLDAGGLPNRLVWARLRRHGDGRVSILDCDGNTHLFASYEGAREWLLEDEYERLESLLEQGEAPRGTAPPCAETDAELVKLMVAAARAAT